MKDYVVFSIGSNKQLAKDFAKFWNCQMGKVSVKRFSDGEVSIRPLTDTKDKDVIIIESTAKKPHDHIFEILLLLDAINGSQARSIVLVIPYLAYARKLRASDPNEPIGYQVMTKVLETGKYEKRAHIASFCGFVPADKPRLTILVVLDEPEKSLFGSVSAKIFSEIATKFLTLYPEVNDSYEIKN